MLVFMACLCLYLRGLTLPEYVEHADVWPLNPKGDLMAIIMIEDKVGIQNIDEILKVKGIGAVIFGPYDYSFSCGHPGETTHPEVLKSWEQVKKACNMAGIPLIGFADEKNVVQKVDENYKILLFGHDVSNSGVITKVIKELSANTFKK